VAALRIWSGQSAPGGDEERSRRSPLRSGWLAVLNRRLGRMSIVSVTALFLVATVVAAMSLHVLLDAAGLQTLDFEALRAAAIVTVLVGTPVILYAQSVIRELLASRRALRLMTERLAWALNNAEQANEAKSAFLASMSHELRTPLNAIIGFSDIMANQRLGPLEDPRYRGYARDINVSGTHLLDIVNDVLDIAKIESGQSPLVEERAVDLGELVQAACVMVAPQAAAGGVALKRQGRYRGARILGLERMLRQVVVNIVSNAVKFTPEGGTVRVGSKLGEDGGLAIVIADDGIGMSSEDIKVALTPFGQVDSPLGRQREGTGLGLPLAKSMMELHGGALAIASAPGEGTTVELWFPSSRVRVEPDEAVDALQGEG